MTKSEEEWKIGDHAWLPVGVMSGQPDRDGDIRIFACGISGHTLGYADPAKLVRAVPALDHLTDSERALVAHALIVNDVSTIGPLAALIAKVRDELLAAAPIGEAAR